MATKSKSPSQLIDARIEELGDWRGKLLSRLRKLIKDADPEVVEEWKWRGVPVWSHDGIICTGETYKNVVKMTFAKGAALNDPSGLFNASLAGNTRRAIDLHEGEKIDEEALKTLVRAAVTLNTSTRRSRSRDSRPASTRSPGRTAIMWPIHLASSRRRTREFVVAALVPMLLATAAIADVTIQSKSASLTAQGTDFFTAPGHQVVINAPDATNFVDDAEVKFHGHGSVNIDVATSQNSQTQVSGDDLTVTSAQSFSILHSAGDADRQNLVSHTGSVLTVKFCTTKRSSFLFTASGQMEVPPGKGTTGSFSGHPFADAFAFATFTCDGCPQIASEQFLIGVNVTGGASSTPPQPSGSSQGSGTIPPGCYELSTDMTADFTSPLLCKNKTGTCEPFQIPPDVNNSPPSAKGSFTLTLQVSPTATDGDKDENITWVGPDNGAFGDPMNWSPQKVPTITADESDTAIFSGGGTIDVDVSADAAAAASALAPRDTATRGTGRLRAKGTRDLIVKHFNTLVLDDTSLDAASLIVGNKSRLHISGGTVIAHNARIGSGGAGTVIVDPQSFFMADRMLISEDGDGLVQVNSGGEADGTEVRVGNGHGLGTVKVDGAGSHFTTGTMSVGFHGRGELDVTNGAELDSADAFVDEALPAAPDPGASSLTGTHCLGRSGGAGASIGGQQSGVSASWHVKTLSIGGLGCAEATARGRIITGEQGSGDVLVGTSAAGSGQLFVVAGGSLVAGGRLAVGESGQGSLELDEDATFDASITVTGAFVVGDTLPPEGQGFVKLVGDPATDLSSLASNSADVEHGIVTLTNGARMATATVAEIGTDAAAHATINTNAALVFLDGAGTDPASLALTRWQIGSALTIGVPDSTFTTGQLEVKNATVEVGSVGSPGQITIHQGGVLSSHGQLQSQVLTHGGTITNEGTIFGSVLLGGNFTSSATGSEVVLPFGGPVIAVGAASARAATTLAGGGSAGKTPPPFGQGPVVFGGDADLSNTTLVLQFMNGFAPHQGDALPIFEAQGQVTGTFAAVQITGLAPGASFNVDTDTGMATSLTDAVALPVVAIKAPAKLKESAKKGGKVKFTRTGATTDPMVVQYRVGGSAQNGLDYAPLSGTITIPAKKKSATLVVVPFADGLPEPPETIDLEVLPGDDYAPNLTPTATITLLSTEKKPK